MISGSGHWMSFIFKICQIVVDISVTSQFYESFNPIFGVFSHLAQLSVAASKNGGLSLSFSCFYSSKKSPLISHFHPFCERVEEFFLSYLWLEIQLFFAKKVACIFDEKFVIFYRCVRLFVWSRGQALRPVFGMPTLRLAEKSSWWHEVSRFISFFLAIIFFLISLISSLVTPEVECSFS